MANLYKKLVKRKDPKTGKTVKVNSKKWWGRYRDADGSEKRVPLARDKAAAQTMLNEMVVKVERRAAGMIDPFDDHTRRPMKEHVDEFEEHQWSKGNSRQHVGEIAAKVRKIVAGCKWTFIRDITASGTQRYLADLRAGGLSVQTSNHYLRAIKQFTRWLMRDRRTSDDQLVHLAMLNVKTDRRHDRRALGSEEFTRLIKAAMSGPPVVCIPGPDRAMMYVLAAWTGYRKTEISSLTKRSLRLDADPPTVTVAAAYSKRKRQDTQVLHAVVAKRLRDWLETKDKLSADALLFPVSAKVPGAPERRTSKMMKADLAAARKKWIEDSPNDQVREEREGSDFLCYQDESGLYADFHSNRHTFITNLERAGVSPRTAQSLARHSDIRLTMGVYTHIGLCDQTTAIESLPAPPAFESKQDEAGALRATGTDGRNRRMNANSECKRAPREHQSGGKKVPAMVPRGVENGAVRLASGTNDLASPCTQDATTTAGGETKTRLRKPAKGGELCAGPRRDASLCTAAETRRDELRPAGFEPATLGSEDRCAIQLRHGRLYGNSLYVVSLPATSFKIEPPHVLDRRQLPDRGICDATSPSPRVVGA